MYDTTVGRWLEEDPEGFAAGDANLYRYVGNNPTNATDPSGLIEVDDNPEDKNVKKLTNADKVVNDLLTAAVKQAKKKYPKDARAGLAYLYQQLASDVPLSAKTTFEKSVEDALENGKTKWLIPLKDSRYAKVPIDPKPPEPNNYEKYPIMWRTELSVTIGLAPAIRISGTPIGTDKLGHFVQQGYWYFKLSRDEGFEPNSEVGSAFRDALGAYMEGGPEAGHLPDKVRDRIQGMIKGIKTPSVLDPFPKSPPGFFGWVASGVHSYADRAANEAGFWFYQDLYDTWDKIDPDQYNFEIAGLFKNHKLDIEKLNEYLNPNRYNPYMAGSVTGPQRK